MSASSYGIIVEGDSDSAVYDAIIRRLTSLDVHIKQLPCEGKTNLMKKFPSLLRTFEYEMGGNPVDMAIVIVDADGRNPLEVEERMRIKIQGKNYPFPWTCASTPSKKLWTRGCWRMPPQLAPQFRAGEADR